MAQRAQAASESFVRYREDVDEPLAHRHRRAIRVRRERESELIDLKIEKGDRPNDPAQQRLQRKHDYAYKIAKPTIECNHEVHRRYQVMMDIADKLRDLVRQRDRLVAWLPARTPTPPNAAPALAFHWPNA